MKLNEKIGLGITTVGAGMVFTVCSAVEFSNISMPNIIVLSLLGFLVMGMGVYVINWRE